MVSTLQAAVNKEGGASLDGVEPPPPGQLGTQEVPPTATHPTTCSHPTATHPATAKPSQGSLAPSPIPLHVGRRYVRHRTQVALLKGARADIGAQAPA